MFIFFTKQFENLKRTCYKRTVVRTKFGSGSLVDSKGDVVITCPPMSTYRNHFVRTADTRKTCISQYSYR